MAYFMMEHDNPLEFVKPLITGYLSVFPLSETALDILYCVVLGRLAQSYINCTTSIIYTVVLVNHKPHLEMCNQFKPLQ